jgi:hypothetical protein
MTKGNDMTLSEVWASIYWTFPDNSFDYVGKPLIIDEGLIYFEGKEYAEVPF